MKQNSDKKKKYGLLDNIRDGPFNLKGGGGVITSSIISIKSMELNRVLLYHPSFSLKMNDLVQMLSDKNIGVNISLNGLFVRVVLFSHYRVYL
jgi:hypothetical protein